MHQHPSSAAAMGAEALWDLLSEDMAAAAAAAAEHGLPPGFRFHPTDEELVTFYLAPKAFNNNNSSSNNNDDSGSSAAVDFIVEVDLNRCEPWELPESARMGGEREWYFFSLRDRKYPTGLRTNRATGAGYWKATGKDKEVLCAATGALIGMKKTLVFYEGRAPRGHKSKWVLHEYRLDGDFASDRRSCKEEWVVCRIFHKAVDQYSSKMMEMRMMSPYHHCYHPMSHRHHPSFVFQEAPPVPFPSPSDQLPVVPFLHHHHHDLIPNQQQPSPLITQNHHQLLQAADKNSSSNNGGFPVPAAACIQDHQPNNNTAPYFPFPSFASASGVTVAVNGAGKAGPLPGVNGAGPQELPPTWPLDNFLQHGTYLYEAGPPAGAPRDA